MNNCYKYVCTLEPKVLGARNLSVGVGPARLVESSCLLRAGTQHTFSSFGGFFCSFVRLSLGGLARLKIPQTHPCRSSASSFFSYLASASTAAIVSTTGTLVRAGAKFSPLLSTSLCSAVKERPVRLTTHLSSPWGRSSGRFLLSVNLDSFLVCFNLALACVAYPLRTIFTLQKTGATRSKRQQDFPIHAGIGETVYPKEKEFLHVSAS